MHYYKLTITMTAKSMGRSDEEYHIFDTQTRCYATLQQVRDYLTGTYGNCKRVKMYVGEGRHIGYIYCFINRDISHNSTPWYQQDWVEVTKVEEEPTLEAFTLAHQSKQ